MRAYRFASVFILITLQLVFQAARAQNVSSDKVTLGLTDDSLKFAIHEIERQTAFRFFYRNDEINQVSHLNLVPGTRTVEQTLILLLQGSCLTFKQLNNHILLQHNELATSEIRGKVITAAGEPVANASVFLNNATIGTMTRDDGAFVLKNIRPGKYDLVVSNVGFETYYRLVSADQQSVEISPIVISPQAILLQEVRVNAKPDPDREVNYEIFKNEFIGNSMRATSCKILNPETIDLNFNHDAGVLTASSSDFIEIENNALGYKIKYRLDNFFKDYSDLGKDNVDFGGPVFFQQEQGSEALEKRWQKQRLQVYEGSLMHLLRSLLNNSFEDEGFRVYRIKTTTNPDRPSDAFVAQKLKIFESLKEKNHKYKDSLTYWRGKAMLPVTLKTLEPKPLKQDEIVKLTSQKGLFALITDKSAFYIVYSKTHHFPSTIRLDNLNDRGNNNRTILSFDEPYILFDKNGCILDPNCVSFEGAWGRNRVAELLPVNYEPDQDIETAERPSKPVENKRVLLETATPASDSLKGKAL